MTLGVLTLTFPRQLHAVAVKTCFVGDIVKQSFLSFIPPFPRMFRPSWPSVSALWASSERCNKADDE